jgi:hypothetical protein
MLNEVGVLSFPKDFIPLFEKTRSAKNDKTWNR